MVYKLVEATSLKEGSYAIIEDTPCVIKRVDISKTGKHGASKVRVEAISLIDGKKKIAVMPGHDRLGIPLIEKKKAQVLSISQNKANIMDLETFETFDVLISEEISDIKDGDNVEYWNIEGIRIIKRKL